MQPTCELDALAATLGSWEQVLPASKRFKRCPFEANGELDVLVTTLGWKPTCELRASRRDARTWEKFCRRRSASRADRSNQRDALQTLTVLSLRGAHAIDALAATLGLKADVASSKSSGTKDSD